MQALASSIIESLREENERLKETIKGLDRRNAEYMRIIAEKEQAIKADDTLLALYRDSNINLFNTIYNLKEELIDVMKHDIPACIYANIHCDVCNSQEGCRRFERITQLIKEIEV